MFRLALALGKTVHEIEATMPMSELAEWVQFSTQEPIGDVRADLRAGIVARTIMMAMGAKKANALDYMPIVRKDIEEAERENSALLAQKFNAFMFRNARNVHILRRKE